MNLLRTVQYTHPPSCPCHGNPSHHHHHQPSSGLLAHAKQNLQRNYATPMDMSRQKEYAFEMAASSIRFGPGVTKEVGMDFKNMGAKRVCVVTDSVVLNLNAMKQVEEGLAKEGIEFTVFSGCRVEPKDSSFVNQSVVCAANTDLAQTGLRKQLTLQSLINQTPSSLSVADPSLIPQNS
jgi:hydroxyacid-oxoacid transhydrogenase